MEAVVGVGALAALACAIEAFRAWSRRRLVHRWADDHHLALTECRYRPFGTWLNWLTAYDVQWQDDSGTGEGRVLATGFLRRRVWLDESGSGRGLR